MNLNFDKYADSLIPAIIQDANTGAVLMLGFMNKAALDRTVETGMVTFFSRTRQQLWTKGETSGNSLKVIAITADCDSDTLLIKAKASGPVCHTGDATCFGPVVINKTNFLFELERIVADRKSNPAHDSYTSKLFTKGINKIAQKVGEEAVELVIEAKDNDPEKLKSEAADLLFHLIVLLSAKNTSLAEICEVLKQRHK